MGTKLIKPEVKVYDNPMREYRKVNQKIVNLINLPFVQGYSEKKRQEKQEELFAKKRALLNAYPRLFNWLPEYLAIGFLIDQLYPIMNTPI